MIQGGLPKIWLPAFGIDRSRTAWNPLPNRTCPHGQYVLSRNIGDDLQSLAVERIARASGLEVGFYERDTLARDGTMGSCGNVLCLTGWFAHSPQWPPRLLDPWVPLFLGYHDSASGPNGRLGALRELAERSPWPIGCRDRHTAALFVRSGVPASRVEVSGCATLTLPESDGSDRPLAVDVPDYALEALLKGVSPVWERATHWMPEEVARNPVRRRAEVLAAIGRLSRARVVATTRLHAALPALAAGRQVVFLRGDPLEARIADYVEAFPLVRSVSRGDRPLSREDIARARVREDLRETMRARSGALVAAIQGLARWRA